MISSVGFIPLNVLKRSPVRTEVKDEDLHELRSQLERTMHQPEGEGTTESETEQMSEDREMDNEAKRDAVEMAREVALHTTGGSAKTEVNSTADRAVDEAMKELRFDTYDSNEGKTSMSFLDQIVSSLPPEEAMQNKETDVLDEGEDDSESESIEFEANDVVLLATKAEDILSALEVWLYEEADDAQEGNLLLHHDIPLAHFPLCCEYLNGRSWSQFGILGSENCNLVAVGSMECEIEIYDLDVLDPVVPLTTLRSISKKKRNSTMTMSMNALVGNVLASGSDDKRVRVWDLSRGEVTAELKLHKASVQCVKWNPNEAPILVSGGHDMRCAMIDVRTPDGTVLEWKLGADDECLAWCTNHHTSFLASDEDGTVQMFDARNGTNSEPIFSMAAHKDNATVVSVCPLNANLFMTGSEDGKVKVWDMCENEPQLVEKKSLDVGDILAGGFCREAGHLIVGAGDSGNLRVWDMRASSNIVRYFPESVSIPQIYKTQ